MAHTAQEAHECNECTFVNSQKDIYVGPDVLKNLTTKPVRLGKFTMPGWNGHANFYAFLCRGCDGLVVDYPHGYTSSGHLFLSCFGCPAAASGKNTNLVLKDKKVYDDEEVALPKNKRSKRAEADSIRTWFYFAIVLFVAILLLLYLP